MAMKNIQIKNYDVFIVRMLLVLLPFVFSFVVMFILGLFIAGHFIDPFKFLTHLFDFKQDDALYIAWGVIILTSIFLVKRSKKVNIEDSITMKNWMSIKTWALSLGNNFESK